MKFTKVTASQLDQEKGILRDLELLASAYENNHPRTNEERAAEYRAKRAVSVQLAIIRAMLKTMEAENAAN